MHVYLTVSVYYTYSVTFPALTAGYKFDRVVSLIIDF